MFESKRFALGGEQGAALGAVTSDFDSLKTFLAQGGDIRTGVALSYVVRSLARPDQIVSVKVATEYDIVTCVPGGRIGRESDRMVQGRPRCDNGWELQNS